MLAREMMREAMGQMNLRQKDLSDESGLSASYVGEILSGSRKISEAAARKICPPLGLDPLTVLKQQAEDFFNKESSVNGN